MHPVVLHVATDRLRRSPSLPREVLIRLVQSALRCASDDAIAAVDRLVQEHYLVEDIVRGVRVVRRGPQSASPGPATADDVDPFGS